MAEYHANVHFRPVFRFLLPQPRSLHSLSQLQAFCVLHHFRAVQIHRVHGQEICLKTLHFRLALSHARVINITRNVNGEWEQLQEPTTMTFSLTQAPKMESPIWLMILGKWMNNLWALMGFLIPQGEASNRIVEFLLEYAPIKCLIKFFTRRFLLVFMATITADLL